MNEYDARKLEIGTGPRNKPERMVPLVIMWRQLTRVEERVGSV